MYSAYVLTEESKLILTDWLFNNNKILKDTMFLHHCTIEFGKPVRNPEFLNIEDELDIIGYAEDEFASAFIVGPCLSKNKIPHITISCAAGIKPFYSNKMLESAPIENISLKIKAIISNEQ